MARLLHPAEGMKTREIPGGTGPRCRRGGARTKRAAAAGRIARMNKSYRQGQILKLIRCAPSHTQEELARALQAPRHRRHAGDALARYPRTGAGEDRRRLFAGQGAPDCVERSGCDHAGPRVSAAMFASAQNLLVLRTPPANANAFAVALDHAGLAGGHRDHRRRRYGAGGRARCEDRGSVACKIPKVFEVALGLGAVPSLTVRAQ